MKNNEHKIIQDLLPNYIENLTSEETNNFITEHIKECDECKGILEEMKFSFNEKEENIKNKKSIKYAKKVNRKLGLLKFIVLVIIVLAFFWIITVARKYFILKKLESYASWEPAYSNGYFVINALEEDKFEKYIYMIDGENKKTISKVIFDIQDDLELKEEEYYINGEGLSIQYANNGQIWYSKKLSSFNNQGYVDSMGLMTYAEFINEYNDYENKTRLDRTITSKIIETTFDGVECYVIEDDICELYVEKDTGIIRKIIYGSYSTDFYYKYNVVDEKEFELPDLTNAIDIDELNS
jgi:hypothetical protein